MMESYVPPILFPGRVKKEKEKEQFRKFFKNLQQLSIDNLFVEALEKIPKYAKFMKDLLMNKAKFKEASKHDIYGKTDPKTEGAAIPFREHEKDPWYGDYANFLVSKVMPEDLTYHLRKKFLSDLRHYIWDEPYLFKSCPNRIVRRCVFGKEIQEILEHFHKGPTEGHYRADITARKIFKSGF
ncbi:hypothetical protein Tco_1098127 [Tanacetum coccineum]